MTQRHAYAKRIASTSKLTHCWCSPAIAALSVVEKLTHDYPILTALCQYTAFKRATSIREWMFGQ